MPITNGQNRVRLFFAAIGGFFIFYKPKGIFIMNKIEYIADGETKNFTFNFAFFDVDDVCVQINSVTQTSGYTVNYVTNGENADIPYTGTNVAFNSAPAVNDKITIYRSIKLNRPVDYQPTVKIDPVALNQDITFAIEVLKDFSQLLADFNDKYTDLTNFPLLETLNQNVNSIMETISNMNINSKANTNMNNLTDAGRTAISNMIMPSSHYISITDNGPGTTYVAPAAGYILYRKLSTASGQYAELKNATTGYDVILYSSGANQSLTMNLMCAQGDEVEIWGTANGETRWLRFVYARGEI